MPIRPENRDRYPADWKEIVVRIRARSGGRCECDGRCGRPACHLADDGRCQNVDRQPAVGTGSTVILTTAHLDHVPEHSSDDNLMHMCQGCHLHYDRHHHAETAYRVRREGKAAGDLFGETPR
jgi:hypothetical protein